MISFLAASFELPAVFAAAVACLTTKATAVDAARFTARIIAIAALRRATIDTSSSCR